jgi:hypothetical protein
MKALELTAIYVYFYARAILRNPGYTLILLALLFFTHKIGTWAAWVLTL